MYKKLFIIVWVLATLINGNHIFLSSDLENVIPSCGECNSFKGYVCCGSVNAGLAEGLKNYSVLEFLIIDKTTFLGQLVWF
jgi:hypothetical protein